jgi:acyl dehydratase
MNDLNDNYTTTATLDDVRSRVGTEIGVSRWFEMPQSRIDAFADVTEDWFYIHTNPERASSETPWGGTIAHGFLTASLISAMAYDAVPRLEGSTRGVNYGFDRLRFVSPVPEGGRIRGRFTLSEANTAKPGEVTLNYATLVEIEGADRPAIAADWITRQFFD